ncbi:MAG TPA: hypothetical protein VMG12_23185 [Polyangiaceae bacterium]|nr:hypothetical protein [Polyangiaceae bacterium]
MILKPTAMDTILQSSTIELMQTYDISVAPRIRSEATQYGGAHEVVGIIAYDAPEVAGQLTLVVPAPVFRGTPQGRAGHTTLSDWTREATNQLMGRIKNRLLQFQLKLRTHIPTVLSGAALERQSQGRSQPHIVYTFGALRGDVVVTVDATLATALLEYSSDSIVVPEGELILFD